MKKNKSYYGSLLLRFFDNELPADQVGELLDWIRDKPNEYREFVELPENQMRLMKYASSTDIPEELSRQMHERLMKSIEEPPITADIDYVPAPQTRFLTFPWIRYAAAIILVSGMVAYLVNINQKKEAPTALVSPVVPKGPDIPPGGSKAVLTLADGSMINLDSATKGTLARQGNSTIIKTEDGQLVYHIPSSGKAINNAGAAISFNTMSTPRGGQYQLRLPDGTEVWLNAASSITYPTVFSEKERRVSITGEAYFEVSKDKTRPFKVIVSHDRARSAEEAKALTVVKNGFEIEVLGTHFNVNSYPDEPNSKTTLLEGQVRISYLPSSHQDPAFTIPGPRTLNAGQQAIVTQQKIQVNNSADIETVMAWKDGIFSLNSADIPAIMRQLSRWYDIEVSYEGNPPSGRISGTVPRNMYLSKVVEAFQLSGINIKAEGKKVVVKQ